MEKTLTFTGEGFEGSGSVALQVYALGSDGRTVGDAVASGDARVEDGSFSAHLQVPGSALKPGTTYRVSAIYEDSRGTVQIVTGGFTVERDGVDASHPSDSLPAERVEAPATEKPADKKPSATPSESAPASAAVEGTSSCGFCIGGVGFLCTCFGCYSCSRACWAEVSEGGGPHSEG